jgi:hypothetical protein
MIKMDNSAFCDPDKAQETARICADFAARISTYAFDAPEGGTLFDSNGNKVGYWDVSE